MMSTFTKSRMIEVSLIELPHYDHSVPPPLSLHSVVIAMELSYTSTTSLQLISLIRRGFPLISTCMQLLRDASDGRVDIHYGDALEVDIPRACQEYVEKKHWEDGRCVKRHQKWCIASEL